MIIRQLIRFIIFLQILFCYGFTGPTNFPYLKWVIGEELVYDVKWSFVKLGELKLTVVELDTMDNKPVYHCQINIDSSPGLPFITIHDVYESWVDADSFYSHHFRSIESDGNDSLLTIYNFQYPEKQVAIHIAEIEKGISSVKADCTATIPEKVFDSLSMLYYARAMARNEGARNIPVFVYSDFKHTDIKFTGQLQRIDVNNKKLYCYFLDGRLKFVGIAGVKEDFEGWFSYDVQSVPLKAAMKAFIGSVKIQISQWKNWKEGPVLFK
jgi:hypothetical protein